MRCWSFVVLLVAAAGCGGSGGSSDPADPDLLAEALVGPAGGTIAVSDATSPFFGTRVEVPPGALPSDTLISIRRAPALPGLPASIPAYELGPSGLTFGVPVRATLRYSPETVADVGASSEDELFVTRTDGGGTTVPLVPLDSDPQARTITVETDHFSLFSFVSGLIWRLSCQEPSIDVEFGRLPLLEISTRKGIPVRVGKGDMQSFWTSSRNLLVVHGFASDPLAFDGAGDLPDGLGDLSNYENIALYQYRSGRGVIESAEWLRQEIQNKAQPGFRVDIVAHSMGGLIARWILETPSTGTSVSAFVSNLVTVGTPHRGTAPAYWFSSNAAPTLEFLRVLDMTLADLGTAGIGPQLNAGFSPVEGLKLLPHRRGPHGLLRFDGHGR